MSKYKPTIGLEVHVELKTKSKMFCGCANDPNEQHPNINICPICMGHPGTLPVINQDAVRKVLMVGKALRGQLADYSQFDRKNYFYPDLPKGYQISQYKYPLVSGGELNGVKITRIHLEEDTGGLAHSGEDSLADFNRAGVPLMELVTEPVVHSAQEAKKFGEELQLVLRYLSVSDADMEKGQMRVEANISISETEKFGTKVEVKNLNSFRAVERAIEYEIKRHESVLEKGGKITQETRGWDEAKQATFSQREKESSHDYRYFPEPDLPSLDLTGSDLKNQIIPELPHQKRERFVSEYGLKAQAVEVFVRDINMAEYFEEVVSELSEIAISSGRDVKESAQLAANYITSDLQNIMKVKMLSFADLQVTPENFAELIDMISEGKINSRVGKDILLIMIEKGGDPSVIVEELGLTQNSNENVIMELAEKIISDNMTVVNDYKNGKEASLQFLVGQGMKFTKGSVNPQVLANILKKKIFPVK